MHVESPEASSGAIYVAFKTFANGNDTKGLFRGPFAGSGVPVPVGDSSLGRKYCAWITDTGSPDMYKTGPS